MSELWLILAIAVLADYRVSRMIAIEEGPFELFLNLRGWIYTRWQKQWVANGVTCPVCISFWLSLPIAALLVLQLNLQLQWTIWLWFALSGAVTFLYKLER